MDTQQHIAGYIEDQPGQKRSDLQVLHLLALRVAPDCRLWFTDGKNDAGKTVANPNIGYGFYVIRYADGTSREFYRIGLSANKSGISVYIMGISDKTFLARTFGDRLGKASVTGYCIRFKSLKDVDMSVLEAAFRYGFELQ